MSAVIKSAFLRRWRKVAVVLALVTIAFITPSNDVFTMCLVALPQWLLHGFSIVAARKAEPKEATGELHLARDSIEPCKHNGRGSWSQLSRPLL